MLSLYRELFAKMGKMMHDMEEPKTIREIMKRMSDRELIEMLPYIRDENGEKVSLIELKHYLNER